MISEDILFWYGIAAIGTCGYLCHIFSEVGAVRVIGIVCASIVWPLFWAWFAVSEIKFLINRRKKCISKRFLP